MRNSMILAGVLFLGLASGCGSSGTAKIQLARTTTAQTGRVLVTGQTNDIPSGGSAVTPTMFQMKIVQAYVVEDVDAATQNSVGKVSRVFVHPDCKSEDGCSDADVGFFDLIDPTAANEKLNSQAKSIDTGTYRYVRVELCVGSASAANVKFQAAGGEVIEKTYGGCGLTSAPLASPVELEKGETITIALDYDLTQGPLYSMPGSETCTATAPCLGGIYFSPRLVQ